MRKIFLMVACLVLLGGCSSAPTPTSGLIWTNIKAPITATNSDTKATLVGRSEATTILGLIATGDASIDAAVKNGGITRIHHVDYEKHSLFGIVTTYSTVVYGN